MHSIMPGFPYIVSVPVFFNMVTPFLQHQNEAVPDTLHVDFRCGLNHTLGF